MTLLRQSDCQTEVGMDELRFTKIISEIQQLVDELEAMFPGRPIFGWATRSNIISYCSAGFRQAMSRAGGAPS